MLRLFRGARLGPGAGRSPPSAPIGHGAGLDQVGVALRTSYEEDDPENLDGRLTMLMLQLSIDPPEGLAPVAPPRHARAGAFTVMARIAATFRAAVIRIAGFSFRRRVR